MDDRRLRAVLITTAVVMLACAAAYFEIRPAPPRAMPDDPRAIAERIAAHHADWRAASAMNEHALDAPAKDRVRLWRASNEMAQHLAPKRLAPSIEFARSAFFHWTELSTADRAQAIAAMQPLLHDPATFESMVRPLFELTGDLRMLRRAAPNTAGALSFLETLAATYGRFDDYRQLRDELRAKQRADFLARLQTLPPVELIGALPPPPYRAADQQILVAALDELHRRPVDADPRRGDIVPGLIDYVVRHHLRPLDGIDFLARSPESATELDRYRLAREIGNGRDVTDIRITATAPLRDPTPGTWNGVESDMTFRWRAWIEREVNGVQTIALATAESDDVPPYVEIYIDDALVNEGIVPATFALPPARGMHRIEIDVVNPWTRNNTPRRVRIVSVAP